MNRSKKGLFLGLGFEAIFGIYTLLSTALADPYQFPKPTTFLSYHKKAVGTVAWAYHRVRSIEYDDRTLERAFLHPKTKAHLDDLFAKDDGKIHAEIAGLISLDSDEQGKYLRFYTTKTINELFGDELLQTDNPLEFLKKNQKTYLSIVVVNEKEYDTALARYISALELRLPGILIKDYLYYSNERALHDGNTSQQLFYEHFFSWSGRLIVGDFHLHNDSNPPSKQDLKDDHGTNSFVISRTTPYTFYRVFDQKATRISPPE